MSTQQTTNINAFRQEALNAIQVANNAQQAADAAVAAFVAQGGEASDVLPTPVKVSRSAKSGKFVDKGEADTNPDSTVNETIPVGKRKHDAKVTMLKKVNNGN